MTGKEDKNVRDSRNNMIQGTKSCWTFGQPCGFLKHVG
jgi:hypothetical protein